MEVGSGRVSAGPTRALYEPYVPRLVQRWLPRIPLPLVEPVGDRFPAAVLLADITGFTSLTEHFARQGDRGAETVQEVVNHCFSRMIDLVQESGGEVVKFAGDATLALWPVQADGLLSLAVWRATHCALAIQETLDGLDAAGSGRLRFRLGIGAGEVWAAVVGGLGGHWESLMGGAPLEQAAQAEREAEPGQVLLSAKAWALARDFCQGLPAAGGSMRILRVLPPPLDRSVPSLELPSGAESGLRAFIPPLVLSRLDAGQGGFLSEFRQVTVMFVGVREGDGSAPEALDRLQAAARCLQACVARYGGSVNQLMVDDKGTTLVAGWGVPLHTHEDDAARGVLAALAVQEELRSRGLAAAVGVASGRVFTGTRGSSQRLEYALIGGAVNLAARLMQAAGAGILCDDLTRAAAGREVLFEALPPIRVKGKPEPVAVSRPLRREKARLRAQREIAGRRAELQALDAELAALRQGGPGGVVILEGEAGMGKSLLVTALLDRAREADLRGLVAAGESLDRSTPYHPFREVFGQLLELDGLADPDAQRSRLFAWLEPDDAARAPLLNPVLPFALAETPATREMTPEARGEVTRSLLAGLFERSTKGEPTLLIVEDAHWLDTASWALAEALHRRATRLLLVVATRPLGEEELTPEYRRLSAESGGRRLQLGALAPEEAAALACRRLGVDTLPPAVVDLIQSKAEGHPLFIVELALTLRDRGLLRLADGRARLAVDAADLPSLDFPMTVQGAIASRIDRLSPEQQLTLKVASVAGRSFALRTVVDVHPLSPGEGALRAQMEALTGLDLLEGGTPEPEPSYLFKHAIIQEVAYGLLPYAQRRPLHGALAAWIERTHGGAPAYRPLLAHHWREAGEARKALDHFEQAGDQALNNFANREAVRFFGAAVELEKEVTAAQTLGRDRQARLRLRLGKAYAGASNYNRGGPPIEEGLELLGLPVPAGKGRQVAGIAKEIVRQVAHRAWPPLFLGRAAGERDLLLEAAAAYEGLVEIYYYSNRPALSFYSALRTLNLAEAAGSSTELARSYALAGTMAGFIPLHRLADFYCRRGGEIAEQTGDVPTLVWVALVTAVFYTGAGRWARAQELYRRTSELSRRIGDERRWSDAVGNLADVLHFQGRFAEALSLLAELQAAAARRGDTRYLVTALRSRTYSLLALGRLEEAGTCLEEVRNLAGPGLAAEKDLTDLDLHGLGALLSLRQGNAQAALEAAGRAAAVIARLPPQVGFYNSVIGCAAVAEVYLALWGAWKEGPGGIEENLARIGDPSQLRGSARRACKALWQYARVYPIGGPAAWLHQGRYDALVGREAKARRAWERCIAEAERLGMPDFRARAERRLRKEILA